MKALSYERLSLITKSEKPYRGTTNRFPVGNRRHNTKDFIVDTLNGETVYRVRYGFESEHSYITKEEYDSAIKNGLTSHYEYEHESDPNKKYYRWTSFPKELGIVRPDNTFEFTMKEGGGQGANSILSTWSRGWFMRSVRHGGMIYKEHNSGVSPFHAVFKGLRLDVDTMRPHESSQYMVLTKQVDRRKTKEFLKPYEDFFKITETMSKSMEQKDIVGIAVELMTEVGYDFNQWWSSRADTEKWTSVAESFMKDRPLDAMLMFCVAHDINDLARQARSEKKGNTYNHYSDFDTLYANFRRRLGRELYAKNPDVFTEVEHMGGMPYPQSSWGTRIVLCDGNDTEVEQY